MVDILSVLGVSLGTCRNNVPLNLDSFAARELRDGNGHTDNGVPKIHALSSFVSIRGYSIEDCRRVTSYSGKEKNARIWSDRV